MGGYSRGIITFDDNLRIVKFKVSGVSTNTWVDAGHSFSGQFNHSGCLAIIHYSNNDGDAQNLYGACRSRSGGAYIGGANGETFVAEYGSTAVQARWNSDGSTYQLQVRTTTGAAGGGGSDVLHGCFILMPI